MTRKILLDTDIGTDVDDCLALALILASPELELVGVTTVYGDVLLRSRMALKLLHLAGRCNVPVAAGIQKPLLGKRPVYWEGHEGQGLLTAADGALVPAAGHAVDFIIHTVMARPGEITLVAIGPLTNIAVAFLREPRLSQALAGLTLMGGVVGDVAALHLPWTEHNFRCDPEAAHIVLQAAVPTRIVPLNVTTQVRIRTEDVAAIEQTGTPFHRAVADQVRRYPRFIERGGWTYLHDPLAVATLLDPSLVHWQAVSAVVETAGEHTAGQLLVTLPPADALPAIHVATAVDAGRAERFIVERLCRP